MDLETISLIRCKGCLKEFAIKTIQKHLGQKPSCKKEYSQEEASKLKEICNAHRKQKLKSSYQNRKKRKIMMVSIYVFSFKITYNQSICYTKQIVGFGKPNNLDLLNPLFWIL